MQDQYLNAFYFGNRGKLFIMSSLFSYTPHKLWRNVYFWLPHPLCLSSANDLIDTSSRQRLKLWRNVINERLRPRHFHWYSINKYKFLRNLPFNRIHGVISNNSRLCEVMRWCFERYEVIVCLFNWFQVIRRDEEKGSLCYLAAVGCAGTTVTSYSSFSLRVTWK